MTLNILVNANLLVFVLLYIWYKFLSNLYFTQEIAITWYDLRLRLQNNTTIDKVAQQQLKKEKEPWKNIV